MKPKIVAQLTDPEEILATVKELESRERLTGEEVAHIEANLRQWLDEVEYILFNLGVHLTTGALRFTIVPLPLPIGTMARGVWVFANKCFFAVVRNKDKAKVHSWTVFGVAIIPLLGYFAYTIPIRRTSEHLSYVYAQHVCLLRKGKLLEEVLANAPKWLQRLGQKLFLPTMER